MTSPIDPIRRAAHLRRARKSDADPVEESADTEATNLPVPVDAPRQPPPRAAKSGDDAAFAAHLLGQDGQKRGLRAGATVIDTAKASYNRTEWSGSKDRRARKGRVARTDI
jgi:hypothetical protein